MRYSTQSENTCVHINPFYLPQTHLLQFVGLGLVFITVGILAIGHAQPPHSQDTVHVISHPGILLLGTGWQKSCNWVLKHGQRRVYLQ